MLSLDSTNPIGPIIVVAVSIAVPATAAFAVPVSQIESISGGAGWAGAGLLGLVLAWLLLVHLPAKDKRDDAKDKAHDETVAKLMTDFRSETEEIRVANQQAIETVCAEFRKQATAERVAWERHFQAIAPGFVRQGIAE